MLHPDFDRTYEFARDRYASLRRRAEVAQVRRRSPAPSVLDSLLAGLGNWLVLAGRRLQRRALPDARQAPQFS